MKNNIDNKKNELDKPLIRIKHYNSETGKVEFGTVLDVTLNTYLVVPDFKLSITVRWSKVNCDIVK
jgi:hypothetical protein